MLHSVLSYNKVTSVPPTLNVLLCPAVPIPDIVIVPIGEYD
jgi:hypothetical protein